MVPSVMGLAALAVFLGRDILPGERDLEVAIFFVLAAHASAWQAMRALDGLPPRLAWLLLPILAWVGLTTLVADGLAPGWLDSLVRAVILAGYNGAAAWSLWLGSAETLRARRGLIALFGVSACLAALRVPLVAWLPQPLGVAPPENWALLGTVGWMSAQGMLGTLLLLLLLREREAEAHRQLSLRDPLTGALNRRAMETRLSPERLRARPATLATLDIDHFKAVNDQHGHAVGDMVLVCVAQAAAETFGEKGCDFYRLGGEEFLCVLPGAQGADAARARFDALRRRYQVLAREVGGREVKSTLSIGISLHSRAPLSLATRLRQADKALYDAKLLGRNLTVVYQETTEATSPRAVPAVPMTASQVSSQARAACER